MLKNLQNNIVLWVQAKTGLSGGFLISLAVAGGAALLTFVFLCVTGYAWLSIQLGPVFGGLAMAGVFLLIAVIGAAASALARRSDPPAGHRGAGGAGSRDKGADRSESAERRDAGGPCARLAAADSAGLAGLSRRAMGAGSAARGCTRSDYLMGISSHDFRACLQTLRVFQHASCYCTAAANQRNPLCPVILIATNK